MKMRKAKLFMMLALLVMGVSNAFSQNVTVHPGNGSMLAAKKTGGGDTFFNWGGFATWKHEQLSLTMTTGDDDNNLNNGNNPLTASGQLANPANDIFASADGKSLQIGKGNGMDTYLTICLPKGYRFTGYTITFHRISQPNGASGSIDNYNGGISFGETNNTFTYTSTTNTTENNRTTYRGGINQNNTTQYTIGRTSQTATDMENVLYFKLSNGSTNGRCFIQLDHMELYFTAEHNYTPLIPAPNVTEKSAVDISFTTSKIDYGSLTSQSDGGAARISYNGTIHDLNANLTLYEDGSVKSVTDNDYDGTPGYVVDYKDGSISSEGDYFRLDPSKHGKMKGDTAIYYLESPIWATRGTSEDAHKNPIGYRIVGADFDYAGSTTYVPATFYIRYESTGHGWNQNGIYGLNLYNGAVSYNYNYQTVWRMDQNGYIYNGEYYLQVVNNSALGVTTTKPNATLGTFEIVDNNGVKQIRRKSNTNQYIGWEEEENWYGGVTRTVVLTTSTDNRSYYDEQSASSGGESLEEFTLLIYDKTGTKVEKKKVVNGTNGTLSIDGLNNDAVKIGIIGTAFIKGNVTMQALDPYIDRIDIVCQEQGGNGGKLTQQFNATDFSVRGGKFTFYVPEDFKAPAKFTFENLYSQYGDSTYYENTASKNHSRYSFVWSPYFQWIATNGDKNVYNTDPNHVYTDKVITEKPGKVKFTFNNAATVGTSGGEFEEYPFNPGVYGESNFDDFIFTQEEMNGGTTKTAYLFTCDETRYNIAPTTATQHTYYAYYEMTIDMQKKTYVPIMTWEKVYDETFYSANTTDLKRDSKWGLKLTTEKVVDDQGEHSGYLTVTQILDYIKGRAASGTQGSDDYVAAIPSALTGGDDAPSTMDQILYIDGSDLMSIVENQTANTSGDGYTSHPTSELKNELDKNALVYLPYGSKSSNDNFAYNTVAQYGETPSFRAANNIVIQDRYPFYAPYDIQVDGAKMAVYERTITNPNYDPILHATIVLPFEINVDANGLHTNNDGQGTPFTLSTMNSSNALARAEGSKTDFYGKGYFTEISEKSVPNTPYIVTLENAGEDGFIAHVNGSLVKATPKAANGVFTNETSTGTFEGTTYNFTHTGTYTGKEIANASTATETVFYFANNYFLDSKTLSTGKSLKILPFRSFYAYTTSGGSAGAKMTRFSIVFGENENDNNTTGISKVQRDADLAVIPGDGSITLMAKTDKDVTIHAVNGQTIDKCNLKAGDSRTVSLPAGVYVINGVKMIVK